MPGKQEGDGVRVGTPRADPPISLKSRHGCADVTQFTGEDSEAEWGLTPLRGVLGLSLS
jgi:hypothetical protein